MNHAKMFIDPLHARKYLGSKLGMDKSVGLLINDKALYGAIVTKLDSIKAEYSRTQMNFLGRFDDLGVKSLLQDTVTTQRAESIMAAALLNHIRSFLRGVSNSTRGYTSSAVSGDN